MSEQSRESKLYTTGEIAKLCNVSVRTVQYYDSRSILIPTKLSEGGRRLYTEEDLNRMKIICFLRDIGISINSINELFADDDPGSVISILLDQQEALLSEELKERQNKLNLIVDIKQELKSIEHFSVESIGDIAHLMENKKKLFWLRFFLIICGVIMECIEIGTAIFWWQTGIWWPFAAGMGVIAVFAVLISFVYYRKVAYLCPKCHTVFKPTFGQMFWAYHTPKMRKLTCPHCGRKGLCVEIYGKEIK